MVLLIASFAAGLFPLLKTLQTLSESEASGRDDIVITLVVISFSFVAIMIMFMSSSLQLRIDGYMLQYRFKPLVNQWRSIRPEEIRRWEVRKYAPLRESGGWGVRYSFKNKSTAYTISGRHVLDIELVSGKHILIGTSKPQELEKAMEKMMQKEG
jgi:hypothetical protein